MIKAFKRLVYSVNPVILLALLSLAAINILVQFSANNELLGKLATDIVYLSISFVILLVVSMFNTTNLKNVAVGLYVFSIILLLLVFVFGVKVHGARRWLNLGLRIQPSEICKLSVPVMVAYYCSLKHNIMNYKHYVVALLLILLPCALIAKQPDLGTSILVFSSGFFVLFFAGLPWRAIIGSIALIVVSAPMIWKMLHPYQQHRITAMLNPKSDPLGVGYHVIQGIIAIGSGGFFGKGYLHGTQVHLDFIPEKHTDFVVTVLSEEFGFMGVMVVLLLYIILIMQSMRIFRQIDDFFSKILVGSIIMSFTLYVFINMGMVSGMLPVVGVPLPFISYGGTATIILMINFGIILSARRRFI